MAFKWLRSSIFCRATLQMELHLMNVTTMSFWVLTTVLCGASSADTFTVCLDGSCDYSDIQQAINASSDGDVIEIAAGTYFPASTIDTLGKAITVRGAINSLDGTPITTIDGQGMMRVAECTTGEGQDTIFEHLVFAGGLAAGNWSDNQGGGMYISSAGPTVLNCLFTGNLATFDGGGVYSGVACTPIFRDCGFIGNWSGFDGAGMYTDSSFSTLEACTFALNSSGFRGGGIFSNTSVLSLVNCVFNENSAYGVGGGMNNEGSSVLMNGCEFTGNIASQGGGMFNQFSIPSIANTRVCGNTPDQISGPWTDDGGNTIAQECPEPCDGDLNDDATVNGGDLGLLLVHWGAAGGDLNGDGTTDGGDLGLLLGAWGPCK